MNSVLQASASGALSPAEIVAALSEHAAQDGALEPAEVVETHAARVVLAADKAYKIKKPVTLPFLDFSTLELRRKALARELEINIPHAPEVYLGLRPLTRTSGGTLRLGGQGEPVEWALEMRRFDQSDVLSERALKRPLDAETCKALAAMAARYHQSAPAANDGNQVERVRATLGPLLTGLEAARADLGAELLAPLRPAAESALIRNSDLLQNRMTQGSVRRCHGDLHLGNIVMIGGRPVPFDALEFDEDLATIDVLYDLAFLLMDLEQRGDPAAANLVLNTYLGFAPFGNEIEGLACLPLFLAMRACVRALVAVTRARQQQGDEARHSIGDARRLVALANSFLCSPPPALVAVGGFSGTGKTRLSATLAPTLAPAPGAVHIRTDVERKRLFGVADTDRLSPAHYRPEVSEEVYRIVFNKAARVLAAGHSAIVDAVFARADEREAIAAIANNLGRNFAGLWLEAPADTLLERVSNRRGDASDADAAVVREQLARRLGTLTWSRIDARGTPDATSALAGQALSKSAIAVRPSSLTK